MCAKWCTLIDCTLINGKRNVLLYLYRLFSNTNQNHMHRTRFYYLQQQLPRSEQKEEKQILMMMKNKEKKAAAAKLQRIVSFSITIWEKKLLNESVRHTKSPHTQQFHFLHCKLFPSYWNMLLHFNKSMQLIDWFFLLFRQIIPSKILRYNSKGRDNCPIWINSSQTRNIDGIFLLLSAVQFGYVKSMNTITYFETI